MYSSALLQALTLWMYVSHSSQETCTWERKQDTKIKAYSRPSGTSVEDCKTKCLSDAPTCVAVSYAPQDGQCLFAKSQKSVPLSGVTWYLKICTQATTAPTTTTTTPPTTTTTKPPTTTTAVPQCTMSSHPDQDGDSAVAVLPVSGREVCEAACKHVEGCAAYVLPGDNSECKMFKSIPGLFSAQDSQYGLKRDCESGLRRLESCCFITTVNVDSDPSADYTSLNLTSDNFCRDLCHVTSNCAAVSHNPATGQCSVFVNTPTTTSRPGVMLFKKTCPSPQSNTASLKFTSVCSNKGLGNTTGHRLEPYRVVYILLSTSILFLLR